MAVRDIRLLGDPVLRTPADPVTSFDAELRRLVADLMDTLARPGRAGVAAPQIGVSARVFSYDADGHRGHLVNPEIVRSDEQQAPDEEGCLSLPGLSFPTPRAMHVTARGFDQHGTPVTIEASGYLARCLQHEADHLDGRLYVDHLTGMTRRRALREIRAVAWGS